MAVTVPPRGSRGSRFPKFPGVMARFFSRMQQRSFRKAGGGRTSGGVQTLMLETIGAKSGETRVAMLGFLDEAPGSRLVIASLAGSARNPSWIYNLAKQPLATIELPGGRRVTVEATSLDGPELETAWRQIEREAPEYARYLSVTDRSMPVIRLREVS